MKKLVTILVSLAATLTVYAQDKPAKELTPQQKMMASCNKEVAGLKGDERKQKLSACLAGGKKSQQEVMKACAAKNKGKKGDEYKAAQKECLSKGG